MSCGDAAGANAHLRLAATEMGEEAPERACALLAWAIELLPGDAHAQHIFNTDQAEALTSLILEFLAAPVSP